MEEMMNVLKKKSHVTYDMNCIEKYIKAGDCDRSLEQAWKEYKLELDEIEDELRLLSNPATKDLEEEKLHLLHSIEDHQKEIHMLERQIKEVEHKLMAFMV